MKRITTLFIVFLLLGSADFLSAQQRIIAKASKSQLESIGITKSEGAIPDWRVFSSTDTTVIERLKNAGIYSEVDYKAKLCSGISGMQWWLTGNNNLWNGNFSNAWNITTGSSKVKIGLIDSGSPLKDGLWTNPGLDSSRFIVGPSFIDITTQSYADSDWANTDYEGHATHVAGIIASLPNDSVGIEGIDQKCTIEIYKAFNIGGWGYYSSIANAIYRAVKDSCRVINMSFGGPYYSRMLEDAVKYAADNGVLSVVSAGNDGAEVQSFPAFFNRFSTYENGGLPGIISVGSVNMNGNVSVFSDRGYFTDIYAPGGTGVSWPADSSDILSTWPTYFVSLDDTTNGKKMPMLYNYLAGTSMSAPMVTGTASLMLSVNPELNGSELREIICATADTLMTVDGPVPILDPEKAVETAKTFNAVTTVNGYKNPPSEFKLKQNYPNPFNPTTTISFTTPKSERVRLEIYNTLGQKVSTLFDGASSGQRQVVFNGSKLSSGIYFYSLETNGTKIIKKMILVK